MGKSQRDKGARTERQIVQLFQDHGLAAERVPLSGQGQSAGSRFFGDVTLPVCNVDRPLEIKCRANGFRELYKWLEGCWALVVKADRKTPLVVLPMPEFIELVKQAEKGKASNGIPESEAA